MYMYMHMYMHMYMYNVYCMHNAYVYIYVYVCRHERKYLLSDKEKIKYAMTVQYSVKFSQ